MLIIEARAIATPPSNSLPPSYWRIGTLPALDVAFLILIISVLAASIYTCIFKTMQYSFSLKLRYKVPCYHCQYFSHNPYIKCALHPGTVLTEKAVDCKDYRPNSVTKRVEEQDKRI